MPISSADEFQAFLDLTTPTEGSQGPFNSTGVHEGAKSFWRNITFAQKSYDVNGKAKNGIEERSPNKSHIVEMNDLRKRMAAKVSIASPISNGTCKNPTSPVDGASLTPVLSIENENAIDLA